MCSSFQGGGTKGAVDFVEKAFFYGMELYVLVSNIQQINDNNYV